MKKEPTWNDFQDAKPAELVKTYKINYRELEIAHRKHLEGASMVEMRNEYDALYRRNRKDA